MKFKIGLAEDCDWLADFYDKTSYGGEWTETDILYYASDENEVVGVVRIAQECGIQVLRGMQILNRRQGNGIGNKLMEFLIKNISTNPIYCIPHSHLETFYSRFGFKKIENIDEIPKFLVSRFAEYRSKGMTVSVMLRN